MSCKNSPSTLKDLAYQEKKTTTQRQRHKTRYCMELHYEDAPHNPTRSEQAVWRCVIVQALTDALSHSRKKRFQRQKQEALSWLIRGGLDFRTVCDYAGYDAGYVHRHVLKLLHQQGALADALPTAPLPPTAPVPAPDLFSQFRFSVRLPQKESGLSFYSPFIGSELVKKGEECE